MQPKLLSLLIALCLGAGLTAQTEVSGGIFDSTIWEAANSPYLVTSEIVVFPGASLTIEAGVEVQFNNGVGIELRSGSIYVNGLTGNAVRFTINPNEPQGTNWRGIYSTTPLFTPINIVFDNFEMEFAEQGIKYNGGGYRYINNGTFRSNLVAAEHGDEGYDWLTFTNCNFFDNEVGCRGRASFFNCNFGNNVHATEDLYSFADGSEGARVVDCTFNGNDACFINNATVINRAIIRNSLFQDNGLVATAFYIEADSSSFVGSTEHAIYAYRTQIRNSYFSGNGIGLRTTETSEGDTISLNTFTENVIGVQLDGNGTRLFANTICSNQVGVLVNTPDNVNISQNCWCTTDADSISSQIYDAFDDVASGIATFNPINNYCIDTLLFAGDANSDGQANAWDLLLLGVHYGELGPARANGNSSWNGVEANNWGIQTANGLDLKHVDTDGNGMIASQDAEIIAANYGFIHNQYNGIEPVLANDGPYALNLILPTEINTDEAVSLPLEIADINNPLSDFYGIAFSLEADGSLFAPGSFTLDFTDSWLGTEEELLYIFREFPAQHRVEVAIVRKDRQPVSGHGLIANLGFVMSEDLIVSLGTVGDLDVNTIIDLNNVQAITHEGYVITTTFEPQTLIISSNTEFTDEPLGIQLYPNPTTDRLYLGGDGAEYARTYRISNQQGAIVATGAITRSAIELGGLPQGLYLIQINTEKGTMVQKILLR